MVTLCWKCLWLLKASTKPRQIYQKYWITESTLISDQKVDSEEKRMKVLLSVKAEESFALAKEFYRCSTKEKGGEIKFDSGTTTDQLVSRKQHLSLM